VKKIIDRDVKYVSAKVSIKTIEVFLMTDKVIA